MILGIISTVLTMNDFRKIAITYNYETDKTSINLSKEFLNLPPIYQLDALQDAIAELTKIYNRKLNRLDFK